MTLVLDNIPTELDAALRKKAADNHKSLSEVAIEALKMGLGVQGVDSTKTASTNLAARIRARFSPLGGVELQEPVREAIPERLDFRE